ncbi:PAS fold-containing protein [Rhizobium tibeticum]|uniref:PAS fold protein n=1 Tax=Rhizobium tibeticum TaxID=501024 RepID=A0A1H8NI77_9HYPH|nr:PAS domain-containing protein [Rhizobium tibeticum]SEH95025.1 PAS fold protein [Rhizobium tibeticum]SEO29148.1 PAS fold-containing protein [Rhizobium tibeticum]
MLGLFRAFSLCCAQIDAAIAAGDDARVNTLDCSIEPLVDAILGYPAANILEVHTQLAFVGCLIDQYAEDSESVRAYVALLSELMERYFGGATPPWRMSPPLERLPVAAPLAFTPNVDNGNFLNSAILEAIPDRVAVLTRDYRYLYSNTVNSAYLGRKPIDMIGRHLIEFIGEKRFYEGAKAKLDACFAGCGSDYAYERRDSDAVDTVRCRMSPLHDSSGGVIGALIILQHAGATASSVAA